MKKETSLSLRDFVNEFTLTEIAFTQGTFDKK